MKKVLASVQKALAPILAPAQKLWAKEPARVVSIVVAALVFVCARLGLIVPEQSIASAVAFALPLLLGGELIRSQVSPVASIPKPPVASVAPVVAVIPVGTVTQPPKV